MAILGQIGFFRVLTSQERLLKAPKTVIFALFPKKAVFDTKGQNSALGDRPFEGLVTWLKTACHQGPKFGIVDAAYPFITQRCFVDRLIPPPHPSLASHNLALIQRVANAMRNPSSSLFKKLREVS